MLGAALQNTGQLTAAIAQFRMAIAAKPDYFSAHYNLALALLKIGQPEEALAHLRQVAAAYPTDERLQQQYAELLKVQGQRGH
jgi:tetratricopeptide (TPR) repeat protein